MNNGLWDAVEELRSAKSDLQARLRVATKRGQELEGELSELRSARARSPEAPGGGGAAGSPTAEEALAAAQVQLRAAESHAQELQTALLELQSAQARRPPAPERGAGAAPAGAGAPAAPEAEAESVRQERGSLAAENGELRRERASLQQRLDVFYQAIELEKASSGVGDDFTNSSPSEFDGGAKAGLARQVECLHSRLILESVTLRNEVARLKKKKWVLRAVLANGGESERRAIDEEVAQSRAAKLERSRLSTAAECQVDVELDI